MTKELPLLWRSQPALRPTWVMAGDAQPAGGGAQGLALIPAQKQQVCGPGLRRRMRAVVMPTLPRRPRGEEE